MKAEVGARKGAKASLPSSAGDNKMNHFRLILSALAFLAFTMVGSSAMAWGPAKSAKRPDRDAVTVEVKQRSAHKHPVMCTVKRAKHNTGRSSTGDDARIRPRRNFNY